MRRSKSIILLMLIVVVVLLLFLFLFQKQEADDGNGDQSQANNNTIYYEDKAYIYNSNIQNILFLGIDNDDKLHTQEYPSNAGQADCIMVLSVNKADQTTRILQISRNAMTDVDIFDLNGNYFSSIEAQLATQYAYGNGTDTSCWATKRTVEELLYNLPISGYFALDISAVSKVNDMLGGVTITIPEDYTMIDPAFVKGETITLTGEQAEKYVRYRDQSTLGSNDQRMERQIQYIPALLEAMRNKLEGSKESLEDFLNEISPYMVTDLDVNTMEELFRRNWKIGKAVYVPGKTKMGEQYEEFHVDKDALKRILIELYYLQK